MSFLLTNSPSFAFHHLYFTFSFESNQTWGKKILLNYVREHTVNISGMRYYSYISHICVRRPTDVGIWVPLHNRNHFLHVFIYTNFPVLTENLKFTKTIPPRTYRIYFPNKKISEVHFRKYLLFK